MTLEAPDLVASLEARTLPPEMLDHRNHVLIAWCYLRKMPLQLACRHFRDVMRAYLAALGLAQEFHQTLSDSMFKLIHARMQPGQDWPAFESTNVELFRDAKSLIGRHYSPERLEAGRRVYVRPDRQPLPLADAFT